MAPTKPTYTETAAWSPSSSPRGNTRPQWFLLHTQEGDGTAAGLAGYLGNPANQVSYHYTVDNNRNVVDVVDTDRSSWSVLDANPRTINLCFAGSRAAWTRAQWLEKMGNAIEIAAWLAVEDCRKYKLKPTVYPPGNYRAMLNTSGISDHRFVTQVLGMGTHTDVGNGFPWDVFAGHVARFAETGTPTVPPTPTPPPPATLETISRKLDLAADQTGRKLPQWPADASLGLNARGEERNQREALAAIIRHFKIPNG